MDRVILEINLHLVNNIQITYFIVSNSVEDRVLTNKINGVLTKTNIHRFNDGEENYYSITSDKVIYTTVRVRRDLDTKKFYKPIFSNY